MNTPANPVVCPHCGCREHAFSKRAKLRPYTCAACRMRFGSTAGQAFNYLENTISFQFSDASYGPRGPEVYIDQDLIIIGDIGCGNQYCVVPITKDAFREFLHHLYNDIHLLDWKAEYDNPEIVDGMQSSLRIRFNGKRDKEFYFDNEIPYAYGTLEMLVKEFIGRAVAHAPKTTPLPTLAEQKRKWPCCDLWNPLRELSESKLPGLTLASGNEGMARYDLCRAIAANYLGRSGAFEDEMERVMDADLIPVDIFIQAEDGVLHGEFGDNPTPEELQRAEETGELIQNGVYGGMIICPSFAVAYECHRYNREHPDEPPHFCL